MKSFILLLLPLFIYANSVEVQVLGSGGPEFSKRASSSYIIWIDGKAKVLIDAGGGSFLRFSQSGAKIEDLSFIALTHLHIDHSADLASFMKAGFFSPRVNMLPILGTISSRDFPDIKTFLERMFGKNGAYAYMSDILSSNSDSFELKAITLDQNRNSLIIDSIKIESIGTNHGVVPALSFAFIIDGKKIVFSGDTSAKSDNLIKLTKDADLFIANHAIPQYSGDFAKKLHMTPKRIGEIAQKANVKKLILSHRMKRTYGKESQSIGFIRELYKNEIILAEDLMRIEVKN